MRSFSLLCFVMVGSVARSDNSERDGYYQLIDPDGRCWTVPAHRMKGGREHRVPLSARAVAILGAMKEIRVSEFVFPGTKPDRGGSRAALATYGSGADHARRCILRLLC